MNPKKNNTKEPEGTRGDKHHPNTIEKSEPLIASDVRGKMPWTWESSKNGPWTQKSSKIIPWKHP